MPHCESRCQTEIQPYLELPYSEGNLRKLHGVVFRGKACLPHALEAGRKWKKDAGAPPGEFTKKKPPGKGHPTERIVRTAEEPTLLEQAQIDFSDNIIDEWPEEEEGQRNQGPRLET